MTQWLRLLSVLRWWFVVVDFCFIHLTLRVGFCVGLCFDMHYFVSFLKALRKFVLLLII